MTDHDLRILESRLADALHEAAPQLDPRAAERLLARTAATAQRRGPWQPMSFTGMLGVAAVVVLAVATGFFLGNLGRAPIGGPDATPTPSATSEAPATTSSPSPTPQTPSEHPSANAGRDAVRCTNELRGYTVAYPEGWHTNAEVRPEFSDPIPACTYFSGQPMEIPPNAGLPATVAISIERWTAAPFSSEGWEVVSRQETTVAGLPAVVFEEEQTSDAGAPFSAVGDRGYGYQVELPDGTVLVAGTSSRADGDYADHRAVLDQMMATLELTGGGEAKEVERPLGP